MYLQIVNGDIPASYVSLPEGKMPVCMLYLLFGLHWSMRQVAGAEAQIEYEKSIQVRS